MKPTAIMARTATRADIPGIAASMARAFEDYPLMVYMVPDASKRAEKLDGYFRLMLSAWWPGEHGEVLTTDSYAGASMWSKPGHWKMPTTTALRMLPGTLRLFGFRSLLRTAKVLMAFEKRHPKELHWHLALLGTDPPMQGQGVGAALMAEVLERCDREGLGAYLETQKPDNVAYYRHHGFEVVDEMTVGKREREVTCWFMWRDPR